MRVIVGIAAIMLASCATPQGYMTASGPDPKTGRYSEAHYSPYYELEQRSDDNAVLARLVITLGGERVPKGYKFTGPFSDDLVAAHRDGIVEWVTEIYFINTSKNPITVMPESVEVKRSLSFEHPMTILPAEWKITLPLVGLHSNYGIELPVSFEYEYRGKKYHVEGIAKRLTVEQVKERYSQH